MQQLLLAADGGDPEVAALQQQLGQEVEVLWQEPAAAEEADASSQADAVAEPWSGWSAHVPQDKLGQLPPSNAVFCCNRGGLQPSEVQHQLAEHDPDKLNLNSWPIRSLLSICTNEMGQHSPDGTPLAKGLWEGVHVSCATIWPLELDGAEEAVRHAATLTAYGVAAAKGASQFATGVQVFLEKTALQGIETCPPSLRSWKPLLLKLGKLYEQKGQKQMERFFKAHFRVQILEV
ncbi:hypothetical protein ABPG75_000177 [Micractinium tetrahymenae]